ncbi:Transport and Golgi organization protein 2 [Dioscorea alata]|uniref:Transport and Golgi organization protein 2 n=1 Tax=Dioscorea alata TaxID=55571 RepID=A0ACB7UUB8_DIOAL|nr:Transport and Golgi organization protein 2 [Dioscorea alata]
MCIAVWAWRSHDEYELVLLLNRDEYHERPTEAVSWWGDGEKRILGGRDRVAGGTWLCCSKNGRLAFLTNFREPDVCPNLKSRGDLPVRFLEALRLRVYVIQVDGASGERAITNDSTKSPLEFSEEIAKEADQYNGFNLIIADLCLKVMAYVSNGPKGKPTIVQLVTPGLHVLSNANLDTPWCKAQRLVQNFKKLLMKQEGDVPLKEMAEKLMQDTTRVDQDQLPNTGCGLEKESLLSSIFIDIDNDQGRYGTRSTTAFCVRENTVTLFERYLESGLWKEHTFQYQIESMCQKEG